VEFVIMIQLGKFLEFRQKKVKKCLGLHHAW
jgi:hypothetical protein